MTDRERRVWEYARFQTLADGWRMYVRAVLEPANVPPGIDRVSRTAWYLGAMAAINLIVETMEPGFEPEAGVNRIDSMIEEIRIVRAEERAAVVADTLRRALEDKP